MHVSSWCLLPHLECLDLSEWSDQNDIEEAIDNELPITFETTWSGEGGREPG